MKKLLTAIAAAVTFAATSASAATVNFNFGGGTIFSVTCATCASGDILGYQTNAEGADAYLVGGAFGLTGTAFNPVNGGSSNPNLSGDANETAVQRMRSEHGLDVTSIVDLEDVIEYLDSATGGAEDFSGFAGAIRAYQQQHCVI